MAITAIELALFEKLCDQGLAILGGTLLELGEANWYGDVPLLALGEAIYRYAPEDKRDSLFESMNAVAAEQSDYWRFKIADIFWQTFLQPRERVAIDLHGTEKALRLDLNTAIDLRRRFDTVLNLGTAEHVFDIAQTFRTIHAHTAPNGLMIHAMPFSGWVDHGFYNVNPTFYRDIAAINGYGMLSMIYAEMRPLRLVPIIDPQDILAMVERNRIGKSSLLYAVLRMPNAERAFRIPTQGFYAGTLGKKQTEQWRSLR